MNQLEFDKLLIDHKEVIKDIGDCILSCNNAVEAIRDYDCLSIGVDIHRPEDAIVEPSKIIIKQIFPTVISGESFI